eukprot:TRINITY_DN6494_c0_g1_i1.p1 TRINITY_DN6494_c0_g1~~TRINITY_DN6494_c0_g1_i1.p1  ORF type:complete len:697 (+),score=150.03 TRINITY_DN6494_c0_g1_i1:79-2169(+)
MNSNAKHPRTRLPNFKSLGFGSHGLKQDVARKFEEERILCKDFHSKLVVHLEKLEESSNLGKNLAQTLMECGVKTKMDNACYGSALMLVAKAQIIFEDLRFKLLELIREVLEFPLREHLQEIKESTKKKDQLSVEEFQSLLEKGKMKQSLRLCAYTDEHINFFSNGHSKISYLQSEVNRIRDQAKKFLEFHILPHEAAPGSSNANAHTETPAPNPNLSPKQPERRTIVEDTEGEVEDLDQDHMTTIEAAAGKKILSNKPLQQRRKKTRKLRPSIIKKSEDIKLSVFGVSLQELVLREQRPIPSFFQYAVEYIDANGLEMQGLFRIEVHKDEVLELKGQIDAGSLDFSKVKSPHVVCILIKQYLRSLPDPLIPSNKYLSFINADSESPETKKLSLIQELIKSLPTSNQNLLHYLSAFCKRIASRSEKNRMDFKNLSSLLAPNILFSQTNDLWNLEEITKSNSVILFVMENQDVLFAHVVYELRPLTPTKPLNLEMIAPVPEPPILENPPLPPPPPPFPYRRAPTKTSPPAILTPSSVPNVYLELGTAGLSKGYYVSKLHYLKIADEDALGTAIQCVFNKNSHSGWIIIGYSKEEEITLQAHGFGGVSELVANLDDKQVQYAIIRIPLNKDQTKDVFVNWNGPQVPAIFLGKTKSHLGEVKALLQPFHADLLAVSRQNFTLEVLMDRSNPLSGSHIID